MATKYHPVLIPSRDFTSLRHPYSLRSSSIFVDICLQVLQKYFSRNQFHDFIFALILFCFSSISFWSFLQFFLFHLSHFLLSPSSKAFCVDLWLFFLPHFSNWYFLLCSSFPGISESKKILHENSFLITTRCLGYSDTENMICKKTRKFWRETS